VGLVSLLRGDNAAALQLASPRVRYGLNNTGENGRGDSLKAFQWTKDSDHVWRATDGNIRFSVRMESTGGSPVAGGTLLHISATAERSCVIELCEVEFAVECATPPWYVSRTYRWQKLQREDTLNDFGPFVVRWEGENGKTGEMRSFAGTHASRVRWKKGRFHISVYVDAAALHPRWMFSNGDTLSTAAPVWKPGASMTMSLLLREAGPVAVPPAIAGRFPGGAEAAYVITDHCDFDHAERLKILLEGDGRENGWLEQGLRMTKGVFAIPSLTPRRRPAPTLAESSYRDLIKRLQLDGSEIVPHGLNEAGNIPGSIFSAELKSFAAAWSPTTWIDHGSTLEYCYTMGGATNPEFDLLTSLTGSGISTLWSYHDVPVQSSSTLNLFLPPEGVHWTDFRQTLRHLAVGEPLVALHYLRSLMHHTLKGTWGRIVIQAMSTLRSIGMTWYKERHLTGHDVHQGWKKFAQSYRMLQAGKTESGISRHPHTARELALMAAVVYPERGVPLHQVRDEDLLLFTTLETVHVRDSYTPDAVDRLLKERGLHVGHCYLLNDLPYIAGIFQPGKQPVRLSVQWTRAVRHLSSLVRAERLWNPTMGQLAAWMRDTQHLSFIPKGTAGMTVKNSLSHTAHGVTILLDPSISPSSVLWDGNRPAGSRVWDDWLAIWGDVPAQRQIVVTWE